MKRGIGYYLIDVAVAFFAFFISILIYQVMCDCFWTQWGIVICGITSFIVLLVNLFCTYYLIKSKNKNFILYFIIFAVLSGFLILVINGILFFNFSDVGGSIGGPVAFTSNDFDGNRPIN